MTVKAHLAGQWDAFFDGSGTDFIKATDGNRANHWLNAIILDCKLDRDEFLKLTNDNNVMTRPIWTLMSKLSMFKDCQTDGLENSRWLEARVVNIPSSVPNEALKKLFSNAGMILVDYKLEFGDFQGNLLLGDEFTPDGCRVWDAETREKLDKDRFRQGLGDVVESYQIMAKRLGVI